MDTVSNFISANPIFLLFLVLTIGFLIGSIKIGSFQLGPVAGVLLSGLLFGHLGFKGLPQIETLGFVLFIFSVGYQAGPRFLENHDEPRAAANFSPHQEKAAAIITFLSPGLRFFHQGQFEGRKIRISPHLVRAMPNTAIGIRESMTCLSSESTNGKALAVAESIFNTVGKSLKIEEAHGCRFFTVRE